MKLLILGLIAFLGVHSVPTAPRLRSRLITALGQNGYKGLFAAIALAGLVLIVMGKADAGFIPLWSPPSWGRYVTWLVMPFAFVLLVAAYVPNNIKRVTAHPMLWGVTLWAVSHLLANGDLASLLLFGGFAVYSLFDMWSANRRGAHPAAEAFPLRGDAAVVAIGFVLYVVVGMFHAQLFGAAAFV